MSEIPLYIRVLRIIRIVLMALAPIGLSLIVASVTRPTHPNSLALTYGGLVLVLAGLVGSFVPRLSMTKVYTWWTFRRFENVIPTGILVRKRAWVTTLVASVILLLGAWVTGGKLSGLPQDVVFPATLILCLVLWVITRVLWYKFQRQSKK